MQNLEPLMTSARSGDRSKDEWLTPLWLYDLLNQEFAFDVDAAATQDNTLCNFWWDDGLGARWWGNIFCNPPYSQMKRWVEKAYEEIYLVGRAQTAVLLVAARTDTRAWWDHIRHGEVRFLPGRLKFEAPDGSQKFSAPFPSAVVVFQKNLAAKTVYWDVREKYFLTKEVQQ